MSNRNIIYSGHPLAIANLQLDAEEFQHVVYMPIKDKGEMRPRLPENLRWTWPAIDATLAHLWGPRCPDLIDWYVYLTVKRSWVDAGTAGNREGWHIDGYGSNGDKNFIWCDTVPAEYMKAIGVALPADHAECLEYLEQAAATCIFKGDPLPPLQTNTLYDLGSTIHRCGIAKVSGMRTFLKVSVSRDKYDLKGNARNPLLPSTHWPLRDRQGTRNHPTAQPGNGRAESYRPTIGQPLLDHVDTWMGLKDRSPVPGFPSDDRMMVREELGLVTATHGIHKGTQIAQSGTEQLHNEGSLS